MDSIFTLWSWSNSLHVMSHKHSCDIADKLWLVPSHGPTIVTSTLLLRFPGLSSHAQTWKSSTPNLDSTYSPSLIHYFLPNTASLYLYLCMLCFAMSSLTPLLPLTLAFPHFWYPQLMLCSLTQYIRLNFVWCCHVWISTLSWTPKPWTSVSGLLEIIFVTSITLAFTLDLYTHISGLCSVPD